MKTRLEINKKKTKQEKNTSLPQRPRANVMKHFYDRAKILVPNSLKPAVMFASIAKDRTPAY